MASLPGECNGYFDGTGILFEPPYEDAAVYYVRSDPDLYFFTKKELILCWFDQTYGTWNGFRYDLRDSRARMSAYLKRSGYASFEKLLQEEPTQ